MAGGLTTTREQAYAATHGARDHKTNTGTAMQNESREGLNRADDESSVTSSVRLRKPPLSGGNP